jgi:hypothetical protein
MVEKITRTLGEARPVCVLWTANYDPCEACAFCELGGNHVIDKAAPLAHQLATLRAAADPDPGKRARWTPPVPTVALTRDERLALPYIAAGWPNKAIAAELSREPRALTDAVLSQIRSSLKRKLCEADTRPIPVCVPEAALSSNICWMPVKYRDISRSPLQGRKSEPQ